MKKLLSVMLALSTLAMAVPVSARADTVQVGYTAELLEATTAAEKTADTRDPDSKLSDGVEQVSINDINTINDLLASYIQKNELDANLVTNEKYPGYQPIVIEFKRVEIAYIGVKLINNIGRFVL